MITVICSFRHRRFQWQTEIYLEVDDVPVVGITAADRVDVTASATVNDDSAMNTLVSVVSLSLARAGDSKDGH